jgi:hypothetical protein
LDETDDGSWSMTQNTPSTPGGFILTLSGTADSDTSAIMRLPSFGTNYVHRGYQSDTRVKLYIDTTDNDSNATRDNTASYGSYAHLTTSLAPSVNKFGVNVVTGQAGHTHSFDIVTPIHTSSHYQTFETPFLHELVGGDRNMEQTNLVVTPDGKTWDEVTRDVGYIGNSVLQATCDSGNFAYNLVVPLDEWRGFKTENAAKNWFNKDFAIAYDRVICLVGGEYEVTLSSMTQENSNYFWCGLTHNGTTYETNLIVQIGYVAGVATASASFTRSAVVFLERGDNLQVWGGMFANNKAHTNGLHIKRV